MAKKKQPEYQSPAILPAAELRSGLDQLIDEMDKLKSVIESPEYASLNPGDQFMVENLYISIGGSLEQLSAALVSIEGKRGRFREFMTAHRGNVGQ